MTSVDVLLLCLLHVSEGSYMECGGLSKSGSRAVDMTGKDAPSELCQGPSPWADGHLDWLLTSIHTV